MKRTKLLCPSDRGRATAEEWKAAEIPELTEADFAKMRPVQEGLGPLVGEEMAARLLRHRERPPCGFGMTIPVGISGCLKKMLHPLTKGVKYERCVFRRVSLIFS